MADERPINADVPAPEPSKAERPAREQPQRDRQAVRVKRVATARKSASATARRPVPGALKGIAALVLLAVGFIAVAVIWGGGGSEEAPRGAAAPVAESPPHDSAEATGSELGYPAFATSNTTRVGGGDPVANAAGVALATYPSTEPRLRPSAVVLADEGNWQAAVAAGVLMAEPVGAPLLFSGADELPEPSADALASLAPQGSKGTGGSSAFVLGDVDTGGIDKVARIRSGSPAATAAAIARLRERLSGKPPEHFVVSPSQDPGFAMPGAAWAARSGDPLLFTGRDSLPKPTAAALKRHPKVPVYLLGPSSAISSDVVREISRVSELVRRVSGEDPVSNSIALARYDGGGFGWNINDPGHGFVIARSDAPLNAGAAAPLSASGTWGPLLLTDSADTLPSALRGYLLDVKPGYTTDPTRAFYNHVWIIGDQEAIDVSRQAEIDDLAELAKIGNGP